MPESPTDPALRSDRASPDRAQWVDIAKAISIVLVLFHHSSPRFTPAMATVDHVLLLFRMPLFFFASGLFLKKIMSYDFAQFAARRMAPLLYLYLVWSLIKWAITVLVPYLRGRGVDLGSILRIMSEPQSTLWFIYALAIFSLIAWLLRKVPRRLVTAAALLVAALALAVGPVTDGPFILRIGRFFLWFWLGYALRSQVEVLVRQHFRWTLLLSVPAWIGFSYWAMASGGNLHVWGLPLTATALLAGLILAAGLERTPLCRPLAALGRNTLPVYVTHFLPLMILAKLPLPPFATPSWAAVSLMIALAMAFAFAAKFLADRIGLGWLYEMPHAWRRAIEKVLPSGHAGSATANDRTLAKTRT